MGFLMTEHRIMFALPIRTWNHYAVAKAECGNLALSDQYAATIMNGNLTAATDYKQHAYHGPDES